MPPSTTKPMASYCKHTSTAFTTIHTTTVTTTVAVNAGWSTYLSFMTQRGAIKAVH